MQWLPFAVKVGCEIDVVGFFSQLFQFRDDLLFTRQHFIVRLPIVPRVNPHTVDESATFILLGFLAVLVEVESALFLAVEPLVGKSRM